MVYNTIICPPTLGHIINTVSPQFGKYKVYSQTAEVYSLNESETMSL